MVLLLATALAWANDMVRVYLEDLSQEARENLAAYIDEGFSSTEKVSSYDAWRDGSSRTHIVSLYYKRLHRATRVVTEKALTCRLENGQVLYCRQLPRPGPVKLPEPRYHDSPKPGYHDSPIDCRVEEGIYKCGNRHV